MRFKTVIFPALSGIARAGKLTNQGLFASMPLMSAPDISDETRLVTLPDEAATMALGRALAPLLAPGDFVALNGDLGAGKTALARAIIQARLGPGGADEEVPSPTFTLVQTYETPDLLITHVDLYRLDDPKDARELGLAEALDEGAVLMEWPEKLGRLPADRLDIVLTLAGDGARKAMLAGRGDWAARLRALKL
jgi:tRNA threonylcarbamoyladenosine biosynthesis protein TsaE